MNNQPTLVGAWKMTIAQTCFCKGAHSCWKDVRSAEEVSLYDATTAQVLTPDCRAWLEEKRVALKID